MVTLQPIFHYDRCYSTRFVMALYPIGFGQVDTEISVCAHTVL